MSENKFRSTPSGRFYVRDLESLFTITLISLDLSEKGVNRGWLGQSYPYSFTVAIAAKVMVKMSLTLQPKSLTTSTIKCGIKEDRIHSFLAIFLIARWLHCPADRTRLEISDDIVLQPTAKGLHILQRHIQRIGYKSKSLEALLLSNYNSMRLLLFERRNLSDQVIQNKSFSYLLFQKMMGPCPNEYSPNGPADSIPLNTLTSVYGDTADYSLYSPSTCKFIFSARNDEPSKVVSPYHHRFYTHPNSTSVSQYYTSSSGVRLFCNNSFSIPKNSNRPSSQLGGSCEGSSWGELPGSKFTSRSVVHFKYCVSGKALWQWVMDCTDAITPGEALDLLALMLHYSLIAPILLEPSISPKSGILALPEAFYCFTKKGLRISEWSKDIKRALSNCPKEEDPYQTNNSSSSDEVLSLSSNGDTRTLPALDLELRQLLDDTGLRYLFREYLDKNMCQENLLFFFDMEKLAFQESMLEKCFSDSHAKAHVWIDKLYTSCNTIYARYFAQGAPNELNVSPHWRNSLASLLSGLQEYFVNGTIITGSEHELQACLQEIVALLDRVNQYTKNIMETDSLPKFLQSPELLQTLNVLNEDTAY